MRIEFEQVVKILAALGSLFPTTLSNDDLLKLGATRGLITGEELAVCLRFLETRQEKSNGLE